MHVSKYLDVEMAYMYLSIISWQIIIVFGSASNKTAWRYWCN